MPNYDYMCKECDHVWEEQQTVASRNVPRYNPCPNCGTSEDIVLVVGSPRIGDPVQLGIRRPEKGFLENLNCRYFKTIRKAILHWLVSVQKLLLEFFSSDLLIAY